MVEEKWSDSLLCPRHWTLPYGVCVVAKVPEPSFAFFFCSGEKKAENQSRTFRPSTSKWQLAPNVIRNVIPSIVLKCISVFEVKFRNQQICCNVSLKLSDYTPRYFWHGEVNHCWFFNLVIIWELHSWWIGFYWLAQIMLVGYLQIVFLPLRFLVFFYRHLIE